MARLNHKAGRKSNYLKSLNNDYHREVRRRAFFRDGFKCVDCGDRDLGPWDCQTGRCELCESPRLADRRLARRIQTIARSASVEEAAAACEIDRRALLRWMTPLRLRAVRVVAQSLWDRQQFEVASACAQLDVRACMARIATLREPWVLHFARTHWAHWPQ